LTRYFVSVQSPFLSLCILHSLTLSLLLLPLFFFLRFRPPPTSTLFPYTTLFRSTHPPARAQGVLGLRSGRVAGYRCAHRREVPRSEEHTSELQSRENLVCRLLLEKKKNK